MTALSDALKSLREGRSLGESAMMETMHFIMDGLADENDLAEILTLLSRKGETVAELTGAARVLRERALTVQAPVGTVDCCGTGGDGLHTYNISTAAALVTAACGVPVAKHGNRSSTSRSGAADVLEALGVNLNASRNQLETALHELNFAFLMAPAHHVAMRHLSAVRKKLGFRTIFNLLGPLANPAGARIQLIGVYDCRWLQPLAETLQALGAKSAWIVHGRDGLDEITTAAETDVAVLDEDRISDMGLSPEDFGMHPSSPGQLTGGDAKENAVALLQLLEGKKTPYRNIVLANAAALLNLSGKASSLIEGVSLAAQAIDSGKAGQTLENYKSRMKE